jgi:hypothetical protein
MIQTSRRKVEVRFKDHPAYGTVLYLARTVPGQPWFRLIDDDS